MSGELIDYSIEWQRHERSVGREVLLLTASEDHSRVLTTSTPLPRPVPLCRGRR